MKKVLVKSKSGNILKGLAIIEPDIYRDNRGLFFESWNASKFCSLIDENINFVQDNHSYSSKNVLRGLHYQLNPFSQGKLVRCSKGKIFDVAVDIRKNSPTFKEWAGVTLDSEIHSQLWIPSGFAHGFLVLSEFADVNYKATNYWSKEHERTIKWNDSTISIDWPIKELNINISEKDANALKIDELENNQLF